MLNFLGQPVTKVERCMVPILSVGQVVDPEEAQAARIIFSSTLPALEIARLYTGTAIGC